MCLVHNSTFQYGSVSNILLISIPSFALINEPPINYKIISPLYNHFIYLMIIIMSVIWNSRFAYLNMS